MNDLTETSIGDSYAFLNSFGISNAIVVVFIILNIAILR